MDDTLKLFKRKYNLEEYQKFCIQFLNLNKNMLLPIKEQKVRYPIYRDYINSFLKISNYVDNDGKTMMILAIKLINSKAAERARSMQRNFVARLLEDFNIDAALIAFYNENEVTWRLSYVSLAYEFKAEVLNKKVTPTKRYSYLVGENEPNHTAREQLKDIYTDDINNPSIKEIEEAFKIEKVTKLFFEEYREKYLELKEFLDKDEEFIKESGRLNFTSEEFAKKLLGQLSFLYFLQKKGWLGVKVVPYKIKYSYYLKIHDEQNETVRSVLESVFKRNFSDMLLNYEEIKKLTTLEGDYLAGAFKKYKENGFQWGEWGSGNKRFIRKLFSICKKSKKEINFFNEFLEPLFYSALNTERAVNEYFKLFNCKIPFLNGGLFEPIYGYDWLNVHIKIPNNIFSNKTDDGFGTGILDVFDTYNFTMNEDEPLEKEVAIDPEMLGKIFENLLDVKDRKSKGAFYTPREIVHYMCQESLISYLNNESGIDREDFANFIKLGDFIVDKDSRLMISNANNKNDYLIPTSIYDNIYKIDELLRNVKIADPAVGSGAFPLGIMNEIVRLRSYFTIYMTKGLNKDDRIELERNRNNYKLKEEVMKYVIHAVDIERSAVDITKLRLWLSLVVDADVSTVNALPNLDGNIKCGNSLIDEFEGIKLFDESILDPKRNVNVIPVQMEIQGNKEISLLNKLEKLQKELFDAKEPNKKKYIKELIETTEWDLIEYKLNKDGNSNKIKKFEFLKKEQRKPYFLWRMEFSDVFKEKGGFDVVIGNPPYVGEKGNADVFQKIKQVREWRNFCTKRMNLYYCFIKKGNELLKKDAYLTYIIPYEWMTADHANKLRQYILNNMNIKGLVHFADNFVFKGIGTTSMILQTINNKNSLSNSFKLVIYSGNENGSSNILNQDVREIILKQSSMDYSGESIWNISEKAENNSKKIVKLGDLFDVRVGIQTGSNKVINSYIIDGLASKDQVGRGIFELRENIDIKFLNDDILLNVSYNGKPYFIAISENDKKYIKPLYSGTNLDKWNINDSHEWIIYLYDNKIDKESTIIKYLANYKKILINRSLQSGQNIVLIEQFGKYSLKDIKSIYSPAGSVQKVMRKKLWYLIFFAREKINFSTAKIMTSSRAETFCYTEKIAYALSGVNYITFDDKKNKEYQDIILKHSNREDYLKYINAILNSKLTIYIIKNSKFNAITGVKLKEFINIYLIDFNNVKDTEIYFKIVEISNRLITLYRESNLQYYNKQIIDLESLIDNYIFELFKISENDIKKINSFAF